MWMYNQFDGQVINDIFELIQYYLGSHLECFLFLKRVLWIQLSIIFSLLTSFETVLRILNSSFLTEPEETGQFKVEISHFN